MNKSYTKGYNFEQRVKKALEREGWYVKRSGKSAFPDLIAIQPSDKLDDVKRGLAKVLFIECKWNKYLSKEEKEKAAEIKRKTCSPMMVAYRHVPKGKKKGEIRMYEL